MRCFVALWPDAAARTRLDALAERLHAAFPRARRMQARNLHLTLAFIGELDEARAVELAAAVSAAPADSSGTPDWALTETGAFERARVLWAGGAPPAALTDLAGRVRALLDAQGIRYDRKPFVPHVTLLRDLPRGAAALAASAIEPPIRWPLGPAVLLRSDPDREGSRYVEVGTSTRSS